jgi:hypothetical protein
MFRDRFLVCFVSRKGCLVLSCKCCTILIDFRGLPFQSRPIFCTRPFREFLLLLRTLNSIRNLPSCLFNVLIIASSSNLITSKLSTFLVSFSIVLSWLSKKTLYITAFVPGHQSSPRTSFESHLALLRFRNFIQSYIFYKYTCG